MSLIQPGSKFQRLTLMTSSIHVMKWHWKTFDTYAKIHSFCGITRVFNLF